MTQRQKQPGRGAQKKAAPRNFTKPKGKHQCQSLPFNKTAGLSPATLLTMRP